MQRLSQIVGATHLIQDHHDQIEIVSFPTIRMLSLRAGDESTNEILP